MGTWVLNHACFPMHLPRFFVINMNQLMGDQKSSTAVVKNLMRYVQPNGHDDSSQMHKVETIVRRDLSPHFSSYRDRKHTGQALANIRKVMSLGPQACSMFRLFGFSVPDSQCNVRPRKRTHMNDTKTHTHTYLEPCTGKQQNVTSSSVATMHVPPGTDILPVESED